MKNFAVRGLEFHSQRMWEQRQVETALDVMNRLNLNTLIFHQNDLLDHVVLPDKYFPSELMWKRWPVRYHRVMNNRQYIRNIVRMAKQRGIGFVAEVKEVWFDEWLIELYPHLRNADGSLCASDPFWWEFVEQKVHEFLQAVPDITGISVSPGTRESKVSISTNTCRCERCRNTSPLDWYYSLLQAMYRPLHEAGKILAVRDFAYSAVQQSNIMKAATKVSDDIVISLKNTPHDYYPTFPNNPEIGHAGRHPQWAEFDTWGQFFGIGFFPASVVEDMKYRMNHCHENGVTGITLRTDWENMTEACAFNSLNFVNVFAGGMLSSDLSVEADAIYKAWVDYGLFNPMRPASFDQLPVQVANKKSYAQLRDFMKASWEVIEKSIFIRGHVFHEDCMFPDTLDRAFSMMTKIHGMDDWRPGASKLVEVTAENIPIIFREKQEAMEKVGQLKTLLDVDRLGIDERMKDDLLEVLELFECYVRGFDLCTRVCYEAKHAQQTRNASDLTKALGSLDLLREYAVNIETKVQGKNYPHHVSWLLDHERVRGLAQDIGNHLNNLNAA